MLPRRHRLTDRSTYAVAIRRGRRVKSGAVVGHLLLGTDCADARIGLIVSKKVGNSVKRHRVSRILRHAAADQLTQLGPGTVLVLRALPGAADRDSLLRSDVADIVTKLPRS